MKERLDKVMTAHGLAATRSQAKSLIEKGDVQVNGIVVERAGELVDPTSKIDVSSPLFVGRGAFKLVHALESFKVPVKDLVFVDLGASTGGFTEVLLKEGARRVYAVDVGHDQLSPKLKEDPRVINLERTNIRELQSLPEICDGGVMDLSFISITKVLDRVFHLLAPEAFLIALIKPQFEAGMERMPKDGVIKDARLRERILNEVLTEAQSLGWKHLDTITSPIQGKAGNVEYLSLLQRRP